MNITKDCLLFVYTNEHSNSSVRMTRFHRLLVYKKIGNLSRFGKPGNWYMYNTSDGVTEWLSKVNPKTSLYLPVAVDLGWEKVQNEILKYCHHYMRINIENDSSQDKSYYDVYTVTSIIHFDDEFLKEVDACDSYFGPDEYIYEALRYWCYEKDRSTLKRSMKVKDALKVVSRRLCSIYDDDLDDAPELAEMTLEEVHDYIYMAPDEYMGVDYQDAVKRNANKLFEGIDTALREEIMYMLDVFNYTVFGLAEKWSKK